MSYTESLGRLIGDLREVDVAENRVQQEKLKTAAMSQEVEQSKLRTRTMEGQLSEQEMRNEVLKESMSYMIDAEYQKLRQLELSNTYKQVEIDAGYGNFIKDKYQLQRTNLMHANIQLKNAAIKNVVDSYNMPMQLGMNSDEFHNGVKFHAVVEAPDIQRKVVSIMESEAPDERFDTYINENLQQMQAEQYLYDKHTRAYEKTQNEDDLLKAQAAAHRLMKYNARVLAATDARDEYIKDISIKQSEAQTNALKKRSEYAKAAQGFKNDFDSKVQRKKTEILKTIVPKSMFNNSAALTPDDYAYAEREAKLAVYKEYVNNDTVAVTHPQLISYLKTQFGGTGQQAVAAFLGVEDERSTITERDMEYAEEEVLRRFTTGQLNIDLPDEGERLGNKAFRDAMFDVLREKGLDTKTYIKRYNQSQDTMRTLSGNYNVQQPKMSKGDASLHRILREKALRTIQSQGFYTNMQPDEVLDAVFEVYTNLCEQEGIAPAPMNSMPTNIITVDEARESE